MKKAFAALLVFALLFCSISSGLAASFAKPGFTNFKADTIDINIDSDKKVTFTAQVSNNAFKSAITLCDEYGNTVARLNDSGTNGDVFARDRTFSAAVKLNCKKRGLVNYYITCNGEVSDSIEINFYRELTKTDYLNFDEVWANIDKIESDMAASGADIEEIVAVVTKYLKSCKHVESICVDSETCVSFILDSGYHCAFTRFSQDTLGGKSDDNANIVINTSGEVEINDKEYTNDGYEMYKNPNVLLIRPYRNNKTERQFRLNYHEENAKRVAEKTGGELTILNDSDTCPGMLLENVYKHGIIITNSHGLDSNGFSYVCVMDGYGYDSADINAGRVASIDGEALGVTSTYFEHYYDEMGITLDGCFFYFGTCNAMSHSSLNQPLLNLGAAAVCGYDNVVTVKYEQDMLFSVFDKLFSASKNDSTRSNTLEYSVNESKKEYGTHDPYAMHKAVLHITGNGDFVMFKPAIAADSITVYMSKNTVSVNNSIYLRYKVEPENACGYTVTWTTENAAIASARNIGYITGISEGKTKAVCTLTQKTDKKVKTLKQKIDIEVFYQPVTNLKINSFDKNIDVGRRLQLETLIYPADASNKTCKWESSNPGVASVTNDGMFISIIPGNATLTCISEDGGFVDTMSVCVTTNSVYKRTSKFRNGKSYIIATDDDFAVSGIIKDKSYASGDVTIDGKYIVGNPSFRFVWTAKASNGAFTLQNKATETCLFADSKGHAVESKRATQTVEYDSDNRTLRITNAALDFSYLFLKTYGFRFGKQSASSDVALYEMVDFTDKSLFSSVTFKDYDGSEVYTQYVINGNKIVLPANLKRIGYTFLGWSKNISNVRRDITVTAIYKKGSKSGIYITFIGEDGKIIATNMLKNGVVEYPNYKTSNGKTVKAWTPIPENATQNMTVFPIISGDVNNDGKLNTGDASAVLCAVSSGEEFDDEFIRMGDFNGDGKLNAGDASAILIYLAK